MGRSPFRWLMFILVKSIFMETDVTSIQCHCTRGCSDGFFCKTGGQCEKGWSGPTCQKRNIALGKPTQQSSTANDCKWAGNDANRLDHCGFKNSTLAVDGRTSSDYWSGHTCMHTQTNQQQAWWSVDLGERHQISDIKIFFPNPRKYRMKNFRALVDGHPCYQWSKTDPPTSPLLVTCDTSLIGHNITIVSGRVSVVILNLCEVEIYECSDGTFGADCSKQCHCGNVDEICNKTTGHCLSGCTAGYTGPGCNHECANGTFGVACRLQCRCRNVDEICNKATGHCLSGCTAGYTGPGCNIKNIALGKPTQQSSTANDCQWAGNDPLKLAHCGYKNSTLAVDGKTSSDYWSGTCTHTQPNQQQAWWSVDLGERHQISDIKIFFPNAIKNRMKDFRALVDGHLCYHWSKTDPPTSPLLVTCDTSLIGRSITIMSGRVAFVSLNLCEVEIYECSDSTFGADCSKQCHCRNVSEICNKTTGHCLSGCTAGYTGPGCTKECTDGYYGPDCVRCGQCFGNSSCVKLTGQCPDGCQAGWKGDNCEIVCDNGTYGLKCSGTCGRCRGDETCDKNDGSCDNGCQEGFSTPLCQECTDGFYGPDCVRCGQCFGNSACDKLTGQCPDGCQAGWKGDNCQEVCDNGTYGLNCSGTCGRCGGDEMCDKNDGTCSNGCQEGFSMPLCHECTDGYYGPDCVRCVSEEKQIKSSNGVPIRFVIIAVLGGSLMSSLGTCIVLAIRRRISTASIPKQCSEASTPHLYETVTNRAFEVEEVEARNDEETLPDHVYTSIHQ